MNKEEIYKQITNFNKKVIKDKETQSKKFYYVQDDVAYDKANFFNYLIKNENLPSASFKNIIDLTYGSGNLTSHILLDCNIEYEDLTLNDIDIENRNNELNIGKKTQFDYLDSSNFNDKYDLIIFNPQIGGSEEGSVSFETNLTPILHKSTLEDYLIEKGLYLADYTISYDENSKRYEIFSETKSKKDMEREFKDIKLFNYNDVFYKSKESLAVGNVTNIVKFRKTLEKISSIETLVIFFGEEKHKELLFSDYTYERRYLDKNNKQFFVLAKFEDSEKCFERNDSSFIINENCILTDNVENNNVSFDELLNELNSIKVDEDVTGLFKTNNLPVKFSSKPLSQKDRKKDDVKDDVWKDFRNKYLNILFKGVPGTGKSYAVNKIIENYLNLDKHSDNILRVNIHSASSNSDLMQGIGISSKDGNISYNEKQGLIMDIIKRATFNPEQPFVLVLEEIQENSLNELIGDLIYLIEDEKRTKLDANDKEYSSYEELVNTLVEEKKVEHYVKIPFLVSDSTIYRKMILPNNLFIFCTSNYRDDKKIIEDNLLRRFEVIEIYPNDNIASEYSRSFLKELNTTIVKKMSDEIHPDRFMIGHAIFSRVKDENDFYRVLLKVVTEFKDIKEVDFDSFKEILVEVQKHMPNDIELELNKHYYGLIKGLQEKINYEFLKENKTDES